MHLIELIVLSARLRERKDRSQRTQACECAKRSDTAQTLWTLVLGMCPHDAPQKIEGDITIFGAPLLSADCHSGVALYRIHCV
jgi:hypothetical protein